MEWTVERCLKEEAKFSRTDLNYLKEWHKKQPHLPPMTDMQIVTFLHANEYSLERTKVCIDKFFTMRTHAPELFGNRDVLLPENARQANFTLVAELPKRDANGYRVVILGLQPAADLSELLPERSGFLTCAMVEQLVREWPTCPGFTFVMDAQNLQFGHLAKTPVMLLKKLLTYVQEASPLRMKIVHVVNINPLVEKVMLLIKPFLGAELQQMLRFHAGAMESFYEALPRDMLPKELGGDSGSALDYHWQLMRRLEGQRDLVLAEESQKVDEARRPGRAQSAGDVFGVDGSFKALDID